MQKKTKASNFTVGLQSLQVNVSLPKNETLLFLIGDLNDAQKDINLAKFQV